MSTVILSKTAQTGQQIEVKSYEYLPGQHIAQLFIDGNYVSGPERPQALSAPKNGVTHFLGGGFGGQKQSGKPAVGLTADEAARINAALDAADRAAAETPEAGLRKLMDEREGLTAAVRGLEEDEQAARERMMEDESNDGAFPFPDFEGRINAARRAVAAFDSAHPEVVACLQSERAERVRSFEAAN